MRRKVKNKEIIMAVVIVLLLGISIGYAYLETNLNITSNVHLKKESECKKILKASSANGVTKIKCLATTDTTNMVADDGTDDHNTRYIGANPNNYVKFNNELWRIVGVFNNIKTTASGEGEARIKIVKNGYYNTSIKFDSNDVNDYSTSSLKTTLNGTYLNSLTSEAQSQIDDAVWNLGGTANYNSSSNGLASHWYKYERGTTVYSGHATTWTGKVGLFYPSDYGYATSGGSTSGRTNCLAKEMYNWYSMSNCYNNDYLYDKSYTQWTISPRSDDSTYVFTVNAGGYVRSNGNAYSSRAARPAVFLKSKIEITSGKGTEDDPYLLELPKTASEQIVENAKTDTTNMVADDGTADHNTRYIGANPNNYVKFNNELWRIVGVFNNIKTTTSGEGEARIKIVKNGYYNTSLAFDSNSVNDYSQSELKTTLNETYLNSLTTEAQSQINDAVWNLGETTNYITSKTSDFYSSERGTIVSLGPPTWTGKIGLFYPSDYGYATSGGSTSGRTNCLNEELINWNDSNYRNCKDNDYLYDESYVQWAISPRYDSSNIGVSYVDTSGIVYYSYTTNLAYAVRPAVFLKSSITISGGTGTSEDPYTLG